jgi:hypothetical protein
LACLRRTQPLAFGIETLTVPDDDLDTRMRAQPSGSGRRGSIGQHVDDFARLQIDDDRAECPALLPCPLVDPDHTRFRHGASGRITLQLAQDSVVACRHAEARQQPLGWPPSCGMTEQSNDLGRALGALRGRNRQHPGACREDAPIALLVPAPPAADPQFHRCRLPVGPEGPTGSVCKNCVEPEIPCRTAGRQVC